MFCRASAQLVGSNLLDTRAKLYDVPAVVILFGNHKVTSSLEVVKVLPHQSLSQISLMLNLKKND